jgi:hypothetical protein
MGSLTLLTAYGGTGGLDLVRMPGRIGSRFKVIRFRGKDPARLAIGLPTRAFTLSRVKFYRAPPKRVNALEFKESFFTRGTLIVPCSFPYNERGGNGFNS